MKKAAKQQKRANSAEKQKARPFPIVGIGASAGGLEAFSELLHSLPQNTGMALVLVQHLDPKHGSVMQEILARITKIPVTEVTEGAVVEPDHVYVIPSNTDMVIAHGVLRLGARLLTRGQHMPIDTFLRSLAADQGERAIGVILSGTASDGTAGCSAIKEAGGIVFAQDEHSAKYDSMPRSVINAGSADFVLPPGEIARELARIGKHPYLTPRAAEPPAAWDLPAGNDLNALFLMVGRKSGVDFSNYKQSTLQRRIRRRMVLQKIETLKDYVRFVKRTPNELDELYRDLLIHVTEFFREPEAFEALRKIVFPALFQDRKPGNPIRIWIPGCSTGEEVYSVAITLLEYMWLQNRTLNLANIGVQIFATDVSEAALDRARAGVYAEASVAGISAERLKRFFVRLDGGYQINKSIREMCIFAAQNVTKDPPFSNLDLISCRNLLIYLGPVLQRRVISILHYALKPNGYLILGAAESLGSFTEYFTMVDKKYKIYHKKKSANRLVPAFGSLEYSARRKEEFKAQKEVAASTIEQEVQRQLTDRFVPASIVVNEDLEIVQFHGKTGAYLEPASGHPTFSLAKMAREGLLVDLRAAVSQAKREDVIVRKRGVRIRSDGGTREIQLEVSSIRGSNSQERFYLVVFQEETPAGTRERRKESAPLSRRRGREKETEALRQEVSHLRAQLQGLIEEHETTSEEFKSANEEILSTNEELQSTNEELETAKEELQSSNEELTTLNEEMQNRNAELTSANNDLLNLLGNVNMPVVMVGNDLRIRRFTPPAEKLLNLLPADIGRRLGEIRSKLDLENLEPAAREAIESVSLSEREVQAADGNWHLLRVRPYKTWDNKIAGAVISLQDVDALKRTLEQTRHYADTLIESAREPILLLDAKLRVAGANPAFYRAFHVSPSETEGQSIYELGNRQWDIPKLHTLLQSVLQSNSRVDDFEVSHEFPQLGLRLMRLNARIVEKQPGHQLILLLIEDFTERSEREASWQRRSALLEMIPAAVLDKGRDDRIRYWNKGAEQMYGWSRNEAVGKTYRELLKPEFPDAVDGIESALSKTGSWEGEVVQQRRDGSRIRVESHWAVDGDKSDEQVVLEMNVEKAAKG